MPSADGLVTSVTEIDTSGAWALTDNTTLTDACFVFEDLSQGRTPSPGRLKNWEKFIEAALLSEVLLADGQIFATEPRVQRLREGLGNFVRGLDLGSSHRDGLGADVRRSCRPIKDEVREWYCQHGAGVEEFPAAFGDLHRALYYSALSAEVDLPYHPAHRRETVLGHFVTGRPPNGREEVAAAVGRALKEAAEGYRSELQETGFRRLPRAQFPPLPMLVAREAARVGSWSEALERLRESKPARGLRNWMADVAGALRLADADGMRQLRRLRDFTRGWSTDPDEGVRHRTREVGVGKLAAWIPISLDFTLRDPLLGAPPHLVILNDAFRSAVRFDPLDLRNVGW